MPTFRNSSELQRLPQFTANIARHSAAEKKDSLEIKACSTTSSTSSQPAERRSSEEAVKDRLLRELNPKYVPGRKPHLLLGEKRKHWKELKEKLKQVFVVEELGNFADRKLPQQTREEIEKKLKQEITKFTGTIADKKLAGWLDKEAIEYVEERVQRPLYILNELTGDGEFLSKGTNIESTVYRTQRGRFYGKLKELSPEDRQQIATEQGKPYTGPITLGRGRYGTVKIAKNLAPGDGEQRFVAVKEFKSAEDGETEYGLYRLLHKKLEAESTDDKRYFSDTHELAVTEKARLFLDLAIRGNLEEVIGKLASSDQFTDQEFQKLERTFGLNFLQTLNALHKRGMFHQDIKPENFLFSKNGTFVLSDFEGAATKDAGIFAGTKRYLPPEAEKRSDWPNVKKSDSDKWALGRTIPIFARESTLYKIIVDHFLQHDPDKRSSLDEILALDYFKGDVFKEEELLELVDNL